MMKGNPPMRHGCDNTQVQVLFVDGYKVTIRYSTQKNPSAVKAIKDTLLAGAGVKQS